MSRSIGHQLTNVLAALGMIVLFSPLAMSTVVALAGRAA